MGDDRISYVLKLARAMHGYGYAAHRLEETLGATSRKLGLEAQFFSTPTSIFVSFGPQDDQRTFLLRVEPEGTDLGRLGDADRVTLQVIRGELSAGEGSAALDRIAAAPQRFGRALTTLAFGLASAAAVPILGGGAPEVAGAGIIGIVTGLLSLATLRYATLGRIFEPLAAFVAALLATAIASLTPLSVTVTVLAGLIVLVPGLTLTVAMTELATRHLASGTARISGALLLFVTIIFGVAVGSRVGERVLGDVPALDPVALPGWVLLVTLAVAPVAFAVLLRARPRDFGWIIVASCLGYGGARAGSALLGAELGPFMGALAVATFSNLYALRRDRPSQILLVPGLLILVPGTIGFRSVSALLDRQVLSGIETAFAMVLTATGIVAGMLVANVVVPKRRSEG